MTLRKVIALIKNPFYGHKIMLRSSDWGNENEEATALSTTQHGAHD